MPKITEILESIDELTVEMTEAAKVGNISKIKTLSDIRQKQLDLLKNSEEHASEAMLSKLISDSKTFDRVFKERMEKTRSKINEISENIKYISKYSMRNKNSHINERR